LFCLVVWEFVCLFQHDFHYFCKTSKKFIK
jgi:hypothetical protein